MSGPVLITDGEERSALALTRALGHSGYPVFVCSPRPASLAGGSRFALDEVRVPAPLVEPAEYADTVCELIRRWHITTVIPVSEASLLALLPRRAELGAVLPFPEAETFRRVSDKARLLAEAAALGIATPAQLTLSSAAAIAALDGAAVPYPVVIKPSRSVVGEPGARTKVGVLYAADAAALHRQLDRYPASAYPLLLQQRVIGPGVGIFLLVWNDGIRATFSHRRLREKPPSGGVSVYRESIAADPELVCRSHQLLERFGWKGVAMIEYKIDHATGTPYLMEINARFWGSLQLALDAGVDFPGLLLEAAEGRPARPATPYRLGVRSRWFWGDVDHLLARLRHSPERLALPPGSPGRLRTIAEFFRWRPGDREEILRLSDPRPFLRESYRWFRG